MIESNSTFGFVPTNHLQNMGVATSPEHFDFLKDLKTLSKILEGLPYDDSHASKQLSERIRLLAHAALLTQKQSFIDVGLKIATTFKDFKPRKSILNHVMQIFKKGFNREWLNQLQKIIYLRQKSPTFSRKLVTLSELERDEDHSFLEEMDILSTSKIIFSAYTAYKFNERAKNLMNEWQEACEYDYGYFPLNKASELESFNNKTEQFKSLLEYSFLLAKLERQKDKPQVHYQIMRRIIALSSATLMTGNPVFIEIGEKLKIRVQKSLFMARVESADIEYAEEYFQETKKFFECRKEFNHKWREKWLEHKDITDKNPQCEMLFKDSPINLAIFAQKDLSSVAKKYGIFDEVSRLIQQAKEQDKSRALPSLQSSESDFSDSISNSSFNPSIKNLKNILNAEDECDLYGTSYFLRCESDDEDATRMTKSRDKRERRLREWLEQKHPALYLEYRKKENHLVEEFLEEQGKIYLELVKEYQEWKNDLKYLSQRANLPPCTISDGRVCLFHDEEEHRFIESIEDYRKDPQASFLFYEFFLKRNPEMIALYLSNKNYFCFVDFISSRYPREFKLASQSKTHKKTRRLSNILVKEEGRRPPELTITRLSEDPTTRAKEYVLYFHLIPSLATDLKMALSMFYLSDRSNDYEPLSKERGENGSRLLKMGNLPNVSAILESQNAQTRESILQKIDHIYTQLPLIFKKKKGGTSFNL
ncbi:hypothetical protein PHSC3_000320 [Chlamydiales bacterium STE3]|nr:hypothetical protein PHSC3_000320 [Chlamydiales bacterium STE3]